MNKTRPGPKGYLASWSLGTQLWRVVLICVIGLFVLPAAVSGQNNFTPTGDLATPRYKHTATLLPNGKVLVSGGHNGSALTSAELYDPTTGSWTATGSLATARQDHTATLLPNGKVIVVGGADNSQGVPVASAELYDPVTGAWTATGSLASPREYHTATLLPNGRVLVTGGYARASAELYDPATGVWTATGSMSTSRGSHTATLLPNGKVLAAGGINYSDNDTYLASAELYDPATGAWSATGSLAGARSWYTATLLPNGKVLAAGGVINAYYSGYLASAELYDPATGGWSTIGSMTSARSLNTATLMFNGNVLVAGDYGGGAPNSAELYDPTTGGWTATGSLATFRDQHTATLLPNGKVLVAGGRGGPSGGAIASAELYDVGLGLSASWQPNIDTATWSGRQWILTGSLFTGGTSDPFANPPQVQLHRLDNEQTIFLLPARSASPPSYSSITFTSAVVPPFSGWALITVFASGIPSVSLVTIVTATLTYMADEYGTISGSSVQKVNYLANGTAVTAVPNTGYHFASWSDGVLTAARADATVTSNLSATANFAINTYTLAYAADPVGTIAGTALQTVNYGSNGTLVTAVPNTGYHFVSWSDGVMTAVRTDANITANLSVTANFAINIYALAYAAGSNGTVSGNALQTVNYEANGSTVAALPNTGYHFMSWSDGILTAARTDTNVTANLSVMANFAINSYALTYSAGTGGSITGAAQQMANYGSSGTPVTAVPSAGYHFISWSDGVLTAGRTETNVTANLSATANFALNSYALTYSAGAGGSILGAAQQTVNYGSSGTPVTAVPKAGYHFISWSDGVLTAARTDTNLTANLSVSATFAINSYALTYSAGAGGSISGAAQQAVNYGSNGTSVTAVPNAGYHFISWSDGILMATRTDTNVTASLSATANFDINSYELTYSAGTGGSISGAVQQLVNYGSNGTLVTAVPDTGYLFVNWTDGITNVSRFETNLTVNLSVTANFVVNQTYQSVPAGQPPTGYLSVSTSTTNVAGGWRFPWELAWHSFDEVYGPLENNTWPVQFLPQSGYIEPAKTNVPVNASALSDPTRIAAPYINASGQSAYGNLEVLLGFPSDPPLDASPPNVLWKLRDAIGDLWHPQGVAILGVPAGNHLITFSNLSGLTPSDLLVTPPDRFVSVSQNSTTVIHDEYKRHEPVSRYSQIPVSADATDNSPYEFCGQLAGDAGYGSGIVVRPRVVLTAAHLLFYEGTTNPIHTLRWFFQRQSGVFEPFPLEAAGWYVSSNYVAALADEAAINNGVITGTTDAERNYDIAAVYFNHDAGRGGNSGYLVTTNSSSGSEWLPGDKQLNLTFVGYPLDANYHSTLSQTAQNEKINFRKYSATGSFVIQSDQFGGLPGSSGGPLCILSGGTNWLPLAIYLGQSGTRALFRIIDAKTPKLIESAEIAANKGQNNVGGGIPFVALTTTSGYKDIRVKVTLSAAAIAAGYGWHVVDTTLTSPAYASGMLDGLSPGANFINVYASGVTNLADPTLTPVSILPLQLSNNSETDVTIDVATLTLTTSLGVAQPSSFVITVTGPPSASIVLESTTSILGTPSWTALGAYTLGASGSLMTTHSFSGPAVFIRARTSP